MIFVVCILILLCVQTVLTFPKGREYLSSVESIETVGSTIDEGVKLGQITLALKDAVPTRDIKVMVNGRVSAFFLQENITLTVGNNSLIQIQNNLNHRFTINIIKKDENIALLDVTSEIESKMQALARVFVK